ncbi:MAG: response regulator [Rubrivivax sp.]
MVDALRVVVVDDNADSAETLAALLRLDDCEVWTAGDAVAALAMVEQHLPHCVFFDVMMPGMTGDQLCETLRARHGSDVVLIALTGFSAGDPRVDKTFELADHYFTKPLNPEALAKVMRPLR